MCRSFAGGLSGLLFDLTLSEIYPKSFLVAVFFYFNKIDLNWTAD